MAEKTDVVISGAGPTGLMAAVLLRRCGVTVRVLDKAAQQSHESRAFAVQARSLELFLNLGLSEQMMETGLMASGVQAWVDGKRAATVELDDIGRNDTPFSFLLMVPQSETERILAAELLRLGVKVEHERELIGLEQSADGVSITTRDRDGQEEKLSCAYLVGADGAHSAVRKALGLRFEGAPYPANFLLADCKLDWALGYDRLNLFMRGQAFAAFLPLKGRELVRVIAMVRPQPGERSDVAHGSTPATIAEVEAAFRRASGMEVRLYDPVWTTNYRISHRGADRYRVGRVLIAGDAAHIHSPAGGQGMNTGLQDAANLAWKLVLTLKGGASDSLLESYHSERWPVGEKVLKFTDTAFSTITGQSDWMRKLRNLFVPTLVNALTRSSSVRARAFHFVSQLGIRYQTGLHVIEDSVDGSAAWRRGPRAGHRAPNAIFGRNQDIFGLIDGYRFHVLAISRKPLAEPDVARLSASLAELPKSIGVELRTHLLASSLVGRDKRLHRIEDSQVLKAYGLDEDTPQALFLVRPDGYIAYRSNHIDLPALRSFLSRLAPASVSP